MGLLGFEVLGLEGRKVTFVDSFPLQK
jgi:hypothetical protein